MDNSFVILNVHKKNQIKTCKILKPIQQALHNSSNSTYNVVIFWSESFVYYMIGTRFVVSFVFFTFIEN